MATDVFTLNKACPAILLDTELSFFQRPYWILVRTGVLCVYTVGALALTFHHQSTVIA